MKYGNQERSCTVLILLAVFCIFGSALDAQVPSWSWTQVISGSNFGGYDECPVGWDIATDGQKNSFVVGSFTGTITLGSQTLTSVGSADIFIGKLNSSGQWIWATQAGGTELDHGLGIEVADNGNVFISGSFKTTATFGSTTLVSSGLRDIFIAKLNGQGIWQWAVKAGGAGDDYANKIAVDNVGCSYVTGYYTGSALFGTTTLTSNNYDMFVAKLNSNGTWNWVVTSGGSGNAHGEGITIDSSGVVYVSGAMYGLATFGSVNVSVSNSKPFIAKLDNNGNWLFAIAPTGTGSGDSMDIEIDTLGNCYIIGWLGHTSNYSITFGSTTLSTGMDRSDGFIAKLSASGNWLWAKQYGGSDWDGGWGIGIDSQGNSYITGFYRQSGYFGSTYLSAGSWNRDIFLAKLDTNGVWQWAIKVVGGGHDTGTDVDTDANGNCFVTGWYNSSHYDVAQNSSMFLGAIITPDPPAVSAPLPIVQFNMNEVNQSIDLDSYFDSSLPMTFSFSGNSMINASVSAGNVLSLQPAADWYGTEYITIRATNVVGYVEQTLKVTVIQTWQLAEYFNHEGSFPDNWTSSHAGTTDFPWQPVLIEGDDYAMKTMANTGRTANERLFSPTYNLSNYKDVVVSFDTDFLPYGTGSGTFAYTLNNVTYTVVETFSTATSGLKTYTIPNLDAKPSVKFRWT
ncbi:MAG: hypothetical protein M0Q99_09655, partial [Candidatus Cloacimonetes bacterium]|nr:hypothetical protein [Candidatus Cloacimonadota bacterium]